MAPIMRRKKQDTTPPPVLKPALSAATPRLSPSKMPMNTPARMRTPIRKVHGGGLTSAQKKMMIDNIKLEMNERVRRLRAQYDVQAQALRHRIEMRINRVPKKLWSAKMGELLFHHATSAVGQTKSQNRSFATTHAKVFVEDVKRLSGGSRDGKSSTEQSIIIPKKRATKKNMAPNHSTDLSQLYPSSSNSNALSSSSPDKSNTARPQFSPVKRVPSQLTLESSHDRPKQRSPPPSSQRSDSTPVPETASSRSESTTRTALKISRSNAVKARNFKATPVAPPPPQQQAAEEKHFVKNIGSSGSLKENKVEGVKKDRVINNDKPRKLTTTNGGGTTGSTRRVLRARK